MDGELNGFWWDYRKRKLSCNRRGAKAFCFEIDLLAVNHHEGGRDVLERKFFGDIDTRGAIARDRLLTDGPTSLDNDRRCDFARLLLSLEARRPAVVDRLRDYGARYLTEAVDQDSEILREMETEGITVTPSEFLQQQGFSFEDRALSSIQQLIDNPRVGGKLINLPWRVVRLGPFDGSLVLSDRPLIRCYGYEPPSAAWFLPLSPKSAFCAVSQPGKFDNATPRRLAKLLNVASAQQAEKFVFCVEDAHRRWLSKYLAA